MFCTLPAPGPGGSGLPRPGAHPRVCVDI